MAKKKSNPEIGATVLPPIIPTDGKTKELPEPRDMRKFLGLSAEVAQDTIYCRNWPWRNAKVHFPHDPLMRTVDKFFRNAQGGALYVDEPVTDKDALKCRVKAQAMKEEGFRYVYIQDGMDLGDVMKQLEQEAPRGVA